MRLQSLPFEGTSMGIPCAYTIVKHMIVLIAEELGHVFTEELDDFVYSALLLQSLPLDGISMGRLCADTTVVHICVLIVEELGYVFTRRGNITAHFANQAGKARLALVKAAAWGVCA